MVTAQTTHHQAMHKLHNHQAQLLIHHNHHQVTNQAHNHQAQLTHNHQVQTLLHQNHHLTNLIKKDIRLNRMSFYFGQCSNVINLTIYHSKLYR